MRRASPWLSVFAALLLAVLPPLLLLAAALVLTESLFRGADPSIVAILVVVGAVAWAAILGIVFSRSLDDEVRQFRTLAERGDTLSPADAGSGYQQIAEALDERNRQIATLARAAAAIPIDETPERVVRAVVATVRSVMRDDTWRAAVFSRNEPFGLRAGTYLADHDAPAQPLGDLEQWVGLAAPEAPVGVRDGPWGAFAIADASATAIRATLFAPWAGRGDLTPAERSILSLVGQHAATALEHALLYRQVRDQADELNRLAAVQADFLRGVTHDLQTPLTSIGALATEMGAMPGLPSTAKADLETITHQADRLRRMVAQLLVASRLEAGVLSPESEVFAVGPIVQRTWSALRADRPFKFAVEGPPSLAVGDPDRFEQVMWAVLDNAVKYSPAGTAISVSIDSRDGELSVTVTDRGAGMDDVTRARAFDQFYRSPDARRLAPDGSGIGLYAARGLIEAMGGSISIASHVGRGTAVTICVPAEQSSGE